MAIQTIIVQETTAENINIVETTVQTQPQPSNTSTLDSVLDTEQEDNLGSYSTLDQNKLAEKLISNLDLESEEYIPLYILKEIGNRMLMGQAKEDIKLWRISGHSFDNVQEFYQIANSALDALHTVKSADPDIVIKKWSRIELKNKVNTIYDFSFVQSNQLESFYIDESVSEFETV